MATWPRVRPAAGGGRAMGAGEIVSKCSLSEMESSVRKEAYLLA